MNDADFLNKWLSSGCVMSTEDGSLLVGWGKRRKHRDADPSAKDVQFYFPDYFLKAKLPWFTYEHVATITPGDLRNLVAAEAKSGGERRPVWRNPHHELFRSTFKALQQQFAAGEIAKAVPFVMETAAMPMERPLLARALHSLMSYLECNTAHAYGFWDKGEGMLGATPEILFRARGNGTLETVACAGTKKKHEASRVFLQDPKELHEHQLVVQGIIESLHPYGRVSVGSLRLLEMTRLVHLLTPVTVALQSELSVKEIVNALHPTPAVGAFPRKQGMRWLKDFGKKIDRRRFAAPAGYLMAESRHASCYVAIRNVQWHNSQMHVAAGCGLVPGSQIDAEWAEIGLKLAAIKEMLTL